MKNQIAHEACLLYCTNGNDAGYVTKQTFNLRSSNTDIEHSFAVSAEKDLVKCTICSEGCIREGSDYFQASNCTVTTKIE